MGPRQRPRLRPGVLFALLVAFVTLTTTGCPSSDRDTSARKLVVGLTGKYPPLNFYDESGALTGFDVDFANEVCREIGRTCEFSTLQWDGIIGALLAGRVEVIIGSMAITEERAREVRFSAPYYESGAQLFVPRGRAIGRREDPTLGVTLGTTYEHNIRERLPHAEIRTYKGDTEVLTDMGAGRLDGMVTDRLVGAYMAKKFGVDVVPEGELLYEERIGIPVAPGNEALLAEIDQAIGRIRGSERYEQMLSKYFGEEIGKQAAPAAPPRARALFDWKTVSLLAGGLLSTLRICAVGIGLGLVTAVALATALLSARALKPVLSVLIDFVRATPFMVQLFAIYFGLPAIGIKMGAFTSAVLAMAIHSAAYLAEILKTSYLAVPSGQHVAARALGLNRLETLRHVVFPQMLPGLTVPTLNTVVAMIKDSAIVSVIGVHELMLQSQELIGATFRPMEFYAVAALLYFVVTYPMLMFGRALERRYQKRGLLSA